MESSVAERASFLSRTCAFRTPATRPRRHDRVSNRNSDGASAREELVLLIRVPGEEPRLGHLAVLHVHDMRAQVLVLDAVDLLVRCDKSDCMVIVRNDVVDVKVKGAVGRLYKLQEQSERLVDAVRVVAESAAASGVPHDMLVKQFSD